MRGGAFETEFDQVDTSVSVVTDSPAAVAVMAYQLQALDRSSVKVYDVATGVYLCRCYQGAVDGVFEWSDGAYKPQHKLFSDRWYFWDDGVMFTANHLAMIGLNALAPSRYAQLMTLDAGGVYQVDGAGVYPANFGARTSDGYYTWPVKNRWDAEGVGFGDSEAAALASFNAWHGVQQDTITERLTYSAVIYQSS